MELEVKPAVAPAAVGADGAMPDWKRELLVRRRQTTRLLFGALQLEQSPPPTFDGADTDPPAQPVETAAVDEEASQSGRQGPRQVGGEDEACEAVGADCGASVWPSSSGMRLTEEAERRPAARRGHVKRAVLAMAGEAKGRRPLGGAARTPLTVSLGEPEEIQYGPGIVHKLRDRYISITLRASAPGGAKRPPLPLRRASSLDDLLDEGQPQVTTPKPVAAPPRTPPAADAMKRHRSMETLLMQSAPALPPAPLANDAIVIIEQSRPEAAPTLAPTPAARKRNSSGEDELPPPDLVRQTRQKFEAKTPVNGAAFRKPPLSPKPANLETLRRQSQPPKPPPEPPVVIAAEPKPPTVAPPVLPASPVKAAPPVQLTPPPVKVAPPVQSTPPPTKIQTPPPKVSPPPPKASPPPPRAASPTSPTTKVISQKALENIRANGASFVVSPRAAPNQSHLPVPKKAPQVVGAQQKAPDKQVGVIRPIPKLVSEKNLINAAKSELKAPRVEPKKPEPPVVVAPTPVVPTVPVVVAPPPPVVLSKEPPAELWSNNKRHFNEQPSTQLFDFTTRKSVPDYIENDGLGIRPPPVGEEVDASTGNLLALEISFEIVGGNVLINGRSSLQKQPKANKMRIKFDDGATATFEYPSEASLLLDESGVPPLTSPAAQDEAPPSSQQRGLQPLPSGSGSLASYTPSKMLMAEEPFELGVTRAAAVAAPMAPSLSSDDELLLKPADDQDMVAWSSESASSDLLF